MSGRWGCSLLTGIALAGAVGACGSSSKTISKSEFITRADAICTTGNHRIGALPQPNVDPSKATQAQLPQLASFLDRFIPILQSEYNQLVALPSPSSDKSTIDQAFADVRQNITLFTQLRQRAAARDVTGFRTLSAQESSPSGPNARANALATQFGLKVCGQG